jgi:hypothetical protein
MVWDVVLKPNYYFIQTTPIHILYGHDDEVTCVAVDVELDVAFSGSKVHSLLSFYVQTRMVAAVFIH